MGYGKMSMGQGDFGLDNLAYSGTNTDSVDVNRTSQIVAANNKKLKQHIKEIQRLSAAIGTELDNTDIREQLQQRQLSARKLCKETEKLLKDLKKSPPPSTPSAKNQHRITLTKIANEFSAVIGDYQRVQREVIDKEKFALKKGPTPTDGTNVFDQSRQEQMQEQITATDMAALQERENEMAQMEADIMDVNTIFKDLSEMVQESGQTIDNIENNVESAVVDIQEGNKQLQKAEEYQSKARKKKIILAIVVIVIIIIIALIIYFSVN